MAPADPPTKTTVPPAASRLAPAFAIIVVAAVVILLPGRVHILPRWAPYSIVALLLIPMFLRHFLPTDPVWYRVERVTTLIGVTLITIISMVTLSRLIFSIILRTETLTALTLLASSTTLWLTNVLTFALLYWAIDCKGPDHRETRQACYPDLLFAQAGAGEAVPPTWLPSFMDYLFTSFTTQTAFSPTDTLPLTNRAKALMMLQSLISLVTLVVVASRAIGILQT